MTTKHTAKQAVAASFALVLLATTQAHAQVDAASVNWIMPGCREAERGGNSEGYKQGMCGGVVRGILYASPTVCSPNEVTFGQARAVVVQYLEQRPSRWHESFSKLTNEALSQTWPCRPH